jgi:hypothetical protein
MLSYVYMNAIIIYIWRMVVRACMTYMMPASYLPADAMVYFLLQVVLVFYLLYIYIYIYIYIYMHHLSLLLA